MTEPKLFAGPRVRRLRTELNLTQTRMAETLGVSVSYLNLIERNQRPITAAFLLRLAETFSVDLRTFTQDAGDQMLGRLAEILGDAVFGGLNVPQNEIQEVIQSAPAIAHALTRLYSTYREGLAQQDLQQQQSSSEDNTMVRVQQALHAHANHFPGLESLAEARSEDLRLLNEDLYSALRERLRQKYGVSVRVLPIDILPESLRRYDHHRKQLQLSEVLDGAGRVFQVAVHYAQTEAREVIAETLRTCTLEDDAAIRMMRAYLSRYFAAALVMPYGRFHAMAEQTGYDIALLMQRFGVSYEQVCHRLTTLQRANARGVPFFMIRMDRAGNISKHYAAGRFPFTLEGGKCPLWNIYSTFEKPGEILTQMFEMPDGARYFSIARTVRAYAQPWGVVAPPVAVALGCEFKFMRHLVYASGIDIAHAQATPVGSHCAVCARDSCRQRSQPPKGARLVLDDRIRSPYPFSFVHGV